MYKVRLFSYYIGAVANGSGKGFFFGGGLIIDPNELQRIRTIVKNSFRILWKQNVIWCLELMKQSLRSLAILVLNFENNGYSLVLTLGTKTL